MVIKIKGEQFYLWRAMDADGYELDVLLQKSRDKEAALGFLTKLLGSYPSPRVIVTDKLNSYKKPIEKLFPKADHRKHKGLNNRAENSHQPTRRKEKCLIKFKTIHGAQRAIALMGQTRNLFSVQVGRYKITPATLRRKTFYQSRDFWNQTARQILCV